MSIKQNGGVFGRNPTFNDVTTEGEVTSEGRINAEGGMTVTGGPLVVTDQNFLVQGTSGSINHVIYNPTTQKFGIGTLNPARRFEVFDNSTALAAQVRSGTSSVAIALANTGSTADAVRVGSSGGTLQLSTWFIPRLTIAGGPGSTGDVTINTGNLVIGTSGKGIDFSATAGTGTSELLDDYEEGTWTPTFSAEFTTPPTVTSAQYTKIGRQVTVTMLATDGVVTAGGSIGGLPFTSNASQGAGAYGGNSDTTESIQGTVGQSSSSITNIPARTLTGDTWQITATYFE